MNKRRRTPEAIARHKMKMAGKFFRNQDPNFHKPTFLKGGVGHKGVL